MRDLLESLDRINEQDMGHVVPLPNAGYTRRNGRMILVYVEKSIGSRGEDQFAAVWMDDFDGDSAWGDTAEEAADNLVSGNY